MTPGKMESRLRRIADRCDDECDAAHDKAKFDKAANFAAIAWCCEQLLPAAREADARLAAERAKVAACVEALEKSVKWCPDCDGNAVMGGVELDCHWCAEVRAALAKAKEE